jgi:hypothetical protein
LKKKLVTLSKNKGWSKWIKSKNFERKFLGGGGKGNQHKKQILFAFLSGVVAFVPY